MPIRKHWFAYSARRRDGAVLDGYHRAPSDDDVLLWLREQDLAPVAVEPAWWALELSVATPTRKEILHFTEFMADLLDGEMGPGEAISLLRQEAWTAPFRRVLGHLARDAQANLQLHEAMARHPKVFDPTYRALVAAGLASGQLDRILADHAVTMDKRYARRKKVQTALIYPGITALVLAGAGYALITKVVPVFAGLFERLDAQLPASTIFVLGLSAVLSRHGPAVLALCLAAAGAASLAYRRPGVRREVHRLLLKVPVFGPIFEYSAIADFCRTFSTLHHAGMKPVPALLKTAATISNLHIAGALEHAAAQMATGTTPDQALKASGVLPALARIRTTVAARTGDLPAQLGRAATFYEREVDSRVAQIDAALAPFLVIALGAVLGFLVHSCFMPLQELLTSIRRN